MGKVLAASDDAASSRTSAESELARLRDELDLIAYVASHDLQAPVRIMNYCLETLREKSDGQLGSEAQEALQTIESENARLKAMLQGLLEYVRLETVALSHVPLDAGELAAAAVESLEKEISAAGAAVTCEALPRVRGHRGRLTRLFAQLIDNAVKFRGNATPRVHLSAKRMGDRWTFCVEDNGIGIDPELHEAAFRLFQRLNPADAYPGYGIGLALARKITVSHGGRLWVESEPGKGSRFFFTLPGAE